MVQTGFGSVMGTNRRSGLRPPEDPGFNPRPIAESNFQFQSPIPPMGQRQYTAPRIMPGLERAAPRPDFSPPPVGAATGALPPIEQPGARLPMPVYEEPERPGKLRTALGIGLSGAAGLSGQSQVAASNFFLAPEARAERDYARDLAAYSARQGEWSQYFDEVMQRQELDLSRQQLEELKTRPHQVSRYGALTDREGKVLFQDPQANLFGGGGAQWEANKVQAWNVWLQSHPDKTMATMTPRDRQEAERDALEFRGGVPYELVYDENNIPRRVPRYQASQYRAAVTAFEDPSAIGGVGGGRPPAARQRGLTTKQRTDLELEEQVELSQAFDEESRAAVLAKYDAAYVRGMDHQEGDKLTTARARQYIRIARAELGPQALNISVERLAEAWAKEDGYDTTE